MQADEQYGRQVPSGTARVRRTMNRYGKCTGKPAQAVTDFVPPSDPALKGEGVQHKPERKQAAQDQSEQLSNPSLTHVTLQHRTISRSNNPVGSKAGLK